MKEAFRVKNFQQDAINLITACHTVIENYMGMGLKLTLRQLYYQLVTQNLIINEEKSYAHLSKIVSEARLAGLLDWAAIEDRTRMPTTPNEFENIKELVDAALHSYRLPRWNEQPYYVELWVEKDALAGVLKPLANKYHVTLMVNRGYSSQTAMYEASIRFLDKGGSKQKILLYLGDFDPSGEDMVRDIEDRLYMFGVDNLVVKKIALTMDQVNTYNPPPNPAKIKDPRAQEFISKYGEYSWEVDSINPVELQNIIKGEFEQLVDVSKLSKVLNKEKRDKSKLQKAVKEIMKGKKN